jgi:HEAT repeat protein
MNTNSTIEKLIKQLDHSDLQVRDQAAHALASEGDAATSALLDVYVHGSQIARPFASEAISLIDDEIVLKHAVPRLNDGDWEVRWQITYLMARFGVKAIPYLAEKLKDDDSWVQEAAAQMLGAIGDTSAVPALISAIEDPQNVSTSVREYSVRAIYEFPDERAIQALIGALTDPNWETAYYAASTLGKIQKHSAVTALAQALNDERDVVRAGAATALGELGAVDALPQLLPLLNDNEKTIRIIQPVCIWAAKALENIGTPEALEAVNKWREERGSGNE